jgi:hypothetical protein
MAIDVPHDDGRGARLLTLSSYVLTVWPFKLAWWWADWYFAILGNIGMERLIASFQAAANGDVQSD